MAMWLGHVPPSGAATYYPQLSTCIQGHGFIFHQLGAFLNERIIIGTRERADKKRNIILDSFLGDEICYLVS